MVATIFALRVMLDTSLPPVARTRKRLLGFAGKLLHFKEYVLNKIILAAGKNATPCGELLEVFGQPVVTCNEVL
jgi:hypothetical protein